MVMLLKPNVPFCPVKLKDRMVVVADWFVAMITLYICELVMFPFKVRSTSAPLSFVTIRLDCPALGWGVGVGVGVDVGVDVGVGVNVGVGDGFAAGGV